MELEYPVQILDGISTEPEVRWRYFCTAEEVEWKGSTAVRYLILLVLPRLYTLECTQPVLVSGVHVHFLFEVARYPGFSRSTNLDSKLIKLLVLVKILANSPFWESRTVHSP